MLYGYGAGGFNRGDASVQEPTYTVRGGVVRGRSAGLARARGAAGGDTSIQDERNPIKQQMDEWHAEGMRTPEQKEQRRLGMRAAKASVEKAEADVEATRTRTRMEDLKAEGAELDNAMAKALFEQNTGLAGAKIDEQLQQAMHQHHVNLAKAYKMGGGEAAAGYWNGTRFGKGENAAKMEEYTDPSGRKRVRLVDGDGNVMSTPMGPVDFYADAFGQLGAPKPEGAKPKEIQNAEAVFKRLDPVEGEDERQRWMRAWQIANLTEKSRGDKKLLNPTPAGLESAQASADDAEPGFIDRLFGNDGPKPAGMAAAQASAPPPVGEGMRARHPETGEIIQFVGGKWVREDGTEYTQ